MPIADSRGTPWMRPAPTLRKKLGSRDKPPVDAEALLSELAMECASCVSRVLVAGGAIMFGGTRDRGAVLVRLMLAGETYEDYVSTVAELVSALEAVDFVLEAQKTRSTLTRP